MRALLCIWLVLLAASKVLGNGKNKHMTDVTVHTAEGKSISLKAMKNARATVFVLLSPECPISQQCTQELNALSAQYGNVLFYGVFPGNYYTAQELVEFGKTYGIPFPLLMDTDYEITDLLHGSITPQVFVVSNYNRVLYSGAISNTYKELGKKNAVTTAHYLADALACIDLDIPIKNTSTKAIGCLVERKTQK